MQRSLVRRWFVAIALFGFTGLAAIQLVYEVSVEPWLKLAIRMESAKAPLEMEAPVRDGLTKRIADRETGICGDLARSRVTVAIDLLTRDETDRRPLEALQTSALAATAAVRDALYCSPADGNLWFVLAYAEHKAGASFRDVQRLLAMSAERSPREGVLLLQRSRFLSDLLLGNAEPIAPRVRSDLQVAMETLDVRSILPILASLRDGGRADLAEDITRRFTAERQASLARGGVPKASTLGKQERYRTFDFSPFGVPTPPPTTP